MRVEIYLVGGAVRDAYLGLPIGERDYVVVGATPDDLIAKGFNPVGQFFPVFLHPDTKEEYALARLERKTALGHQGFEFDFSPSVTLEEDLIRRDLTINAMASTKEGILIDPYGGLSDLQQKKLRHVSKAFSEDPLRVLRVARFYARFFHLGFYVDPDTIAYMNSMREELPSLSAERVWGECQRAVMTHNPAEFFKLLRVVNCLTPWFPVLDAVNDAEFSNKMAAILKCPESLKDFDCRAAYFLYCIQEYENSPLRIPNRVLDLCFCLEKYVDVMHAYAILDPNIIMSLFEKCDAIRQPQRFNQMMEIIEAIPTLINTTLSINKEDWIQLLQNVIAVSAQEFVNSGLKGPEIGAAVRNKRIEKIAEFLVQPKKDIYT